MDTGLVAFNIIEPWTEDPNDVCTYLYSRDINFDMRGSTDEEDAIGFDWMPFKRPTTFIIYTAKLMPEDALAICLIFPNVRVKQPKAPEKVSTFARRVLCKDITS